MRPMRAIAETVREWRDARRPAERLGPRQEERLGELVRFARQTSPFYRSHYRAVPETVFHPAELPVVTKPELMAAFDDWVTDARVHRADVEEHVRDPAMADRLFLDRYAAWTSSGVTGERGLFLHDRRALAAYAALAASRLVPRWLGPREVAKLARSNFRLAGVVATGGPYAAASMTELARALAPALAFRLHAFSVLDPLPELVRGLNAFRPAVLYGYPTQIAMLAREQAAGRLRLDLAFVATGDERLTHAMRTQIADAFGCEVREVYSASEMPAIAFGCDRGWMHVNSDWCILEPVDARYEPNAPGAVSATTLLTNLANRVAPVLRYDLGDSILWRAGRCSCGNALPAIRVEGRRDETIHLPSRNGGTVPLAPMALATVLEETPGVADFQLAQHGDVLRIRMEPERDVGDATAWRHLRARLADYLDAQGAEGYRVERDAEPPHRDPITGKHRHVYVAEA